MKYQWNLEEIQKHEKYYKLLLKERDKEKRPRIKTCISQLQDMEEIIKTGYQGPPRVRRLKYKDRQKFLPKNTYDDFNDIHPKVQKVMIEAMKSLANIRDTYDNIELPNVNLTDDDLVEMAVEFASWVPDKNYKRELEKYITSKKHLLQFAKPISKEEMGMTYFFYDPKYRPYFRINRLNIIEDFATMNHELAHGVFFKQDNPMNEYYNHYYLQELEGSFFDFLSYEYLKGKEESSIITKLEYGRTVGIINDLRDFYLTDSAIQLYDKKRSIKIDSIHKRIMQDELNMYLDESILRESLQENPQEEAKSTLSYLTSLDLEKIYESDPEYAFYLMKKIRNNKTENIFGNLKENGITFMSDGYQNLKRKVKSFNNN